MLDGKMKLLSHIHCLCQAGASHLGIICTNSDYGRLTDPDYTESRQGEASGIYTKHCSTTEAYKRMEKRPGVNSGHRMFAPEESQ